MKLTDPVSSCNLGLSHCREFKARVSLFDFDLHTIHSHSCTHYGIQTAPEIMQRVNAEKMLCFKIYIKKKTDWISISFRLKTDILLATLSLPSVITAADA